VPPWDDVEDLLFSDQGIADLLIAIVGAFVGAAIAFGLAFLIFRRQIGADRRLARDERITDAVHEIAGELALWCAEQRPPTYTVTIYQDHVAFVPDARPPGTVDPIRSITRRKALLATAGFDNAMVGIRQAVTDFADRHVSLVEAVRYVWLDFDLASANDETSRELRAARAHAFFGPIVDSVWQRHHVARLDELRTTGDKLAAWNAGDKASAALGPTTIPLLNELYLELREPLVERGFKLHDPPWLGTPEDPRGPTPRNAGSA
jgi:hypothetical protein